MNKIATILGLGLATAFLLGLSTTLTRSSMIGFWDILPVYILMIIAIGMMFYDTFSKKK
jgi:FtsH-binding integral membrane protein